MAGLSLADLCDIAYALNIERLERRVLADRQAAAVASVFGADVAMPTLSEAQAAFDAWLSAEPEPVDTEAAEWRQAMGMR